MTAFDCSVVVPCYNDGAFLPRSIGSVLRQTVAPREILIIDDGSTDDSLEVARNIAAEAPNVCVHHQKNQGVSAARNRGIELARGEWLVFIDADDELTPKALAAYQSATTHNAAEWLIGNSTWELNEVIRHRAPELPTGRDARFRAYLEKRLHLGNISNMCFNADLFRELDFPESLRFGEDLVVFCILLTLTDPSVISDCTAIQHRRDDSLRWQISFDASVESLVPEAIFTHPHLPEAFKRYERTYWARHSRSIMKRAFKEGRLPETVHWYHEMIRANPYTALDLKWAWRYLRARMQWQG